MVPHMWSFCLGLDFQGSPWPPSCFPWDLDPSSLLGFLTQTYKPALSCLKGRVNHDGVYCPHESHLSVCRKNGGMGKLDCSQKRFSLSQVWLWKEKPYTGEERWAEQQESTAHPEFTVLSDVRGAVDHHLHPTECLGSNEDSHTTSTNKTWGTFKWQPVLIFLWILHSPTCWKAPHGSAKHQALFILPQGTRFTLHQLHCMVPQ